MRKTPHPFPGGGAEPAGVVGSGLSVPAPGGNDDDHEADDETREGEEGVYRARASAVRCEAEHGGEGAGRRHGTITLASAAFVVKPGASASIGLASRSRYFSSR